MRRFVEKCLATVSDRLSARELLHDPFLQSDDYLTDLGPVDDYRDFNDVGPMLQEPLLSFSQKSSSLIDSYTIYFDQEHRNGLEYHQNGYETNGIDLLNSQEESLGSVDITINGRRREDDGIFLRLRIADEEGLQTFVFT